MEGWLLKIIVAVIVAILCTGCMFEAQRALGCNNVGVFGCKDKAQPVNTDDPIPRRAEGRPVLTNSRGERYRPETPSWVPLIDNCIIAGGSRNDCIEALPPNELKKLEAWEAEVAAMRREQMGALRGYEVFGGRREVPDE